MKIFPVFKIENWKNVDIVNENEVLLNSEIEVVKLDEVGEKVMRDGNTR